MSFRRRTFPEILENVLIKLADGVPAEEQPFPPPGATVPPFRHTLQKAGNGVAEAISVYGSRDGQPHLFRRNDDYRLLNDKRTLEWTAQAELPDPGTLVSISYFPHGANPVFTDLQIGSVVRTVSESVCLEIGRLYAQLEA